MARTRRYRRCKFDQTVPPHNLMHVFIQPAHGVGPLSARQLKTAFKRRFPGGPLKKTPLLTKSLTRLHNLMLVFIQPAHGVGPLSVCQHFNVISLGR